MQKALGMLFHLTCMIGVGFLSKSLAEYIMGLLDQISTLWAYMYESITVFFFALNMINVKAVSKIELT